MLSENVIIQDLDPDQWINLQNFILRLAESIQEEREKKGEGKGSLFILYEGPKCLKAIHSERGVLFNFKFNGIEHLKEIKREQGVRVIMAVDRRALVKLFHRAQSGFNHDEDFVKQVFRLYNVVPPEYGRGVVIHPSPIKRLPKLRYGVIKGLLDRIIPDNRCFVLCVFKDQRIWTSLITRVRKRDLDLITTSDTFPDIDISGWRRSYTKILKATAKKYSKPALGVFMDVSALERLTTEPGWMRYLEEARKSGEIIVDPFPIRFRMLSLLRQIIMRR